MCVWRYCFAKNTFLCLWLIILHSFHEFLLRSMVYYFIKVIILLLISFSFSPFVFLWDAARERKRNLHTQGDGSKNFESEGPRPPILRLRWFLRGQLENCSGRGGTPSISSSQKRAETWHVLSAWPSGKHTHFRAERDGVGSLALTLPAGWHRLASDFSIGLSGNWGRITPSLFGDMSTNEMFHAKVSYKMQSALKCFFPLHLLH